MEGTLHMWKVLNVTCDVVTRDVLLYFLPGLVAVGFQITFGLGIELPDGGDLRAGMALGAVAAGFEAFVGHAFANLA